MVQDVTFKTHDLESTIVGHHEPVPSGKGWLPMGYIKSITKYTCKVCGRFGFDATGLILLSKEPCPGVFEASLNPKASKRSKK